MNNFWKILLGFLGTLTLAILLTIFNPRHPWGTIPLTFFLFSPFWAPELFYLFYNKHYPKEAEPPHNSIASFCNFIGIKPLSYCLRSVKMNNYYEFWLVLQEPEAPNSFLKHQFLLASDNKLDLDAVPPETLIAAIGLSTTNGGEFEWEGTVTAGNGWGCIAELKEDAENALHDFEMDKGRLDW